MRFQIFTWIKRSQINWKCVLLIVVILVFIISGGIICYLSESGRKFEQRGIKTIKKEKGLENVIPECQNLIHGDAEIPPLYTQGINWQQPTIVKDYEIEFYYFENEKGEPKIGSVKVDGCIIRSVDIPPSEFWKEAFKVDQYYHEELLRRGWINIEAADSPHGSLYAYKKNERYFQVHVFAISLKSFPESPWRVEVFMSH